MTFDYLITLIPLFFLVIGIFGVYLLFRLLMALIIYYERLNREAKNRGDFR
jgi:hypothetical protein